MSLAPIFPVSALSRSCQTEFTKNFELLKSHYRKIMSPIMDFDLWNTFFASEGQNTFFEKMYCYFKEESSLSARRIYLFIGMLTFFEVTLKKPHGDFNQENWEFFAKRILFTSLENVLEINKELFRNNVRHPQWSLEEDVFLKTLLHRYNPDGNKKNSWKVLAKQFNQGSMVSVTRTSSQIKERWENTLKNSFKKGDWSFQEDMLILNFVEENGTKWARISRILVDRNEHNVKNRFFSLISEFLKVPIKKVKKSIDYLDPELLGKTKAFIQVKNEI